MREIEPQKHREENEDCVNETSSKLIRSLKAVSHERVLVLECQWSTIDPSRQTGRHMGRYRNGLERVRGEREEKKGAL